MMRASLASVLVAMAFLASACAGQRAFTQADRQAITKVLDDQREAWNRGDLAGFMAAYEQSPALIFTSGSNIRRGWQITYDKYRERYGQDQSSMGKLSFEILDIRALGSDGAVMLGRWKLTDTLQAGEGVFSLVFLRTEDGWRVVHDHTSSTGK